MLCTTSQVHLIFPTMIIVLLYASIRAPILLITVKHWIKKQRSAGVYMQSSVHPLRSKPLYWLFNLFLEVTSNGFQMVNSSLTCSWSSGGGGGGVASWLPCCCWFCRCCCCWLLSRAISTILRSICSSRSRMDILNWLSAGREHGGWNPVIYSHRRSAARWVFLHCRTVAWRNKTLQYLSVYFWKVVSTNSVNCTGVLLTGLLSEKNSLGPTLPMMHRYRGLSLVNCCRFNRRTNRQSSETWSSENCVCVDSSNHEAAPK